MSLDFALVSDLHLEASNMDLHTGQARVLAACGDIYAPDRLRGDSIHPGVEWLARKGPNVPILYVPGNHDYEGNRVDVALDCMRRSSKDTQVVILWNETFDFEGVRFLGTPLFTDFSVNPPGSDEDVTAIETTTDMRRSFDHNGKPLSMEWFINQHKIARAFLETELSKDLSTPKVVLTHWCPVRGAQQPKMAEKTNSAYWVAGCEDLVKKAELWCHGHLHDTIEMHYGDDPNKGRLVSNPRGFSRLFNLPQNTLFCQPRLFSIPTPAHKPCGMRRPPQH